MEAGKRHALIVATQEYQDPGLRKLRAPARDAEDLARTLRDPQIGNFEVDTVVNAPSSTVRRRVQQFLASASLDTLLFLYFSCHGLKDDAGNLFLATHDTEVDLAEATSVESSLINRHVHRSRAKRIVVVLDCCYSGAFGRELTAKASDRVGVEDLLDLGRGRMWMTSSNSMEYSFEGSDHEHGERSGLVERSVFTRAVVAGLQTGDADRDRDGYVSFDELYQYVFERVQDETPNQHPTRGGALEGPVYIARNPAFRGPAPGAPGSGTGPASPVSRTLPRLNAELQPTASTCRRITRHVLSVENPGALTQTVTCTASSGDGSVAVGVVAGGSGQPLLGRALTWVRGLRHEGAAASLSIEPGQTAELEVVVAVRGWHVRRPVPEHRFEVVVTADGSPPATVEGRVRQLPLVAHPLRVLLTTLAPLLAVLILFLTLTATVPGVYRQQREQAVARLRSAGFRTVVTPSPNPNVTAGLVVRTVPRAHSRAPIHTVVQVVVSSGPGPSSSPKALGASTDSLSLAVGQVATITLTGTVTDETLAAPGPFAATWTSSRPDVASVASGTLTAPGRGTATAAWGP
jgi:hypothetical protein